MSRRRYVYRPNPETGQVEAIEVSSDYEVYDARQPVFTDRHYEGTRSPVDGSDIGSRRKRREHMQAHGLVDADDYKGQWRRDAERRQQAMSGVLGRESRRASIARALDTKGRR